LAASLASSMAQNVYSLNVVGYVNVTLPPAQFTAVANPLDASMGGTIPNGNDFATLFGSTNGNIANGSKIQQFIPSLNNYGSSINYASTTKKWGSTFNMPPGTAALYYNNGATPTVVTFVGQVPQGTYSVATLGSAQFTFVGSPIPIGGDVTNSTTAVGLTPNNGDTIATFNSALNNYNAVTKWASTTKKWSVSATSTGGIAPGQGFLYYNNGANPNNWVSNFTVQ